MASPGFTSSVTLNGRRKYYIDKAYKSGKKRCPAAMAAVGEWSRAWAGDLMTWVGFFGGLMAQC